MTYSSFTCVNCGAGDLQGTTGRLVCQACGEAYRLDDGVPVLLPSPARLAAVAAHDSQHVSLDRLQAVYDRVYEHDGLMGTDLDDTYDRVTKQTLLSFAQPLAGKRILDLGAGIGNLWQYVPPGVEGHAFDVSSNGMRRALQRFPHVTVSVAVAEYIPYADGFFGVVVAADTIEHTFSPRRSLQEIHRVLLPGGILSASFPIPDSLRKWGRNQFIGRRPNLRLLGRLARVLVKRTLLFGRPDFQPIDRDYTTAEWVALLAEAGFGVTDVIEWPPAPKLPIVTLVRGVKA